VDWGKAWGGVPDGDDLGHALKDLAESDGSRRMTEEGDVFPADEAVIELNPDEMVPGVQSGNPSRVDGLGDRLAKPESRTAIYGKGLPNPP